MNEDFIFLECFDFRYIINSKGIVMSLFGSHGLQKPKKLKPALNRDGYYKVTLTKDDGSRIKTSIHRLLATAFLDLIFEDKTRLVNHKNGVKTDNRLENLEIVTAKQNGEHASLLKLYNKNSKKKFTSTDKDYIKSLTNFNSSIFGKLKNKPTK